MADFSRWLDRFLPQDQDIGDKAGPAAGAGASDSGAERILRLDLHGATRDQVRGILDRALKDALARGYGSLLVIHGKGNNSTRGPVLAREVRQCLEGHPLAGEMTPAPARLGGSGAVLVKVRLKTRKKGT